MVGYYNYTKNYCLCKGQLIYIAPLNANGSEPDNWPVPVYNVNGEVIGIASSKLEFIAIWNGDNDNQQFGKIQNFFGPFNFMIIENAKKIVHTIGIYDNQYDLVYE